MRLFCVLVLILLFFYPSSVLGGIIKGTLVIGETNYCLSGTYHTGPEGFLALKLSNKFVQKEIRLKVVAGTLMLAEGKGGWSRVEGMANIKKQLTVGFGHGFKNVSGLTKSYIANLEIHESSTPIQIFENFEGKLHLELDRQSGRLRELVLYSLKEWLNPFGTSVSMILTF